MMSYPRIPFLIAIGFFCLVVPGWSLAQSTPAFLQLDPDDRAALIYWGSTHDPNVQRLQAAPTPQRPGLIDDVQISFDKKNGSDLELPGLSRSWPSPDWIDPDKLVPMTNSIRFGSGQLLELVPGLAAELEHRIRSGDVAGEYLALRFNFPVDLTIKDDLMDHGVTFADPLDRLSFFARIPPEALSRVRAAIAVGKIFSVAAIPPELRISERLQAVMATESRIDGEIAVTVQLFELPSESQLAALARLMRIERRSDGAVALVEGMIAANRILTLAQDPAIQMIHEFVPNEAGASAVMPMEGRVRMTLTNMEGNLGGGSDVAKANGLTGTGVRAMVMDSGIAQSDGTYHPDLPSSRILDQYSYFPAPVGPSAPAVDAHGTHVAGSIGGSGVGVFGQVHQGIAPAVDFLIYRLCCNAPGGLGYFDSDVQASLQRGANNLGDVSNNSWGGGINTYAVSSQLADRAVRGEFGGRWMNVVAITHNDNNLSRSPGTAKNAITVGAVKDGNSPPDYSFNCPGGGSDTNWPPAQRACFSNYGPIDIDGNGHSRVKPDLMAPGVQTMSPVPWYQYTPTQYYRSFNGTSMAAPQVTGAVAQFIQAYPGYRQWPEVIKATLIASATDIGGTNTSHYGRGMINAYHAIYDQPGISDTTRWASSVSASGQNNNHNFTVPEGYSEIRVALAWADPVAGANNDSVINDLDVRVYDANDTLRASSLSIDDTVEYVKITSGAPGTWRIEVRAFSISSSQPYGLASVVIMEPASLKLTSALEPRMGTLPGNTFFLYQSIHNSGFAAAGSYIRLQLPSTALFTLEGARIYTADGRSRYYSSDEIHFDGGGLFWRAATGETIAGHPRVVRWFIRYEGPLLECNPYPLTGSSYYRLAGALGLGGVSQAYFWPVPCDPLFEDRYETSL